MRFALKTRQDNDVIDSAMRCMMKMKLSCHDRSDLVQYVTKIEKNDMIDLKVRFALKTILSCCDYSNRVQPVMKTRQDKDLHDLPRAIYIENRIALS